jgi:maleylacetoacetate isomerase
VRIVLNIKNIEHTIVPVDLLKSEHHSDDYRAKQPQGLVPCMEISAGEFIFQSGAMIDYLDGHKSAPRLLPIKGSQAIKIKTIVDIIACDIHPVCNLRVLKYLTNNLNIDEDQKITWYRHWITEGFTALEKVVEGEDFCIGQHVSLADIYLIPQVYNALRFDVDMQAFPRLMHIYHNCNRLPAFIDAKPENQ